MSFEEEWARARADSVKQQASSMRLNELPAEMGGGGGKTLHVDGGELRGRARKADLVREDFVKADNETMKETEQVGASLKGFKSGPAMDVFLKRWSSQMKYVENLLKNDVAGTLRLSASAFETREHAEADRHRKGGKGSGGAGKKDGLI
ncbi:hypothetical protein ACF090_04150 [Streptomyces sp. NPDC014892]|uniref:hypothetical protein n=1 Tax=Streptomyces sp. NPDC014892 TaxID=3364930 RepID=UPI0036F74E45